MPFAGQVVVEHVETDKEGMVDWRKFIEAFQGGATVTVPSSPKASSARPLPTYGSAGVPGIQNPSSRAAMSALPMV